MWEKTYRFTGKYKYSKNIAFFRYEESSPEVSDYAQECRLLFSDFFLGWKELSTSTLLSDCFTWLQM
jgi:hypothetical protein